MKIEYKWQCKYCEYIGKSRRDLQKHHKEIHKFTRYNFPTWNKGLTKENDERINELSKKLSSILTGLSQRELENTLIHFKEEFEGKYFRRK